MLSQAEIDALPDHVKNHISALTTQVSDQEVKLSDQELILSEQKSQLSEHVEQALQKPRCLFKTDGGSRALEGRHS